MSFKGQLATLFALVTCVVAQFSSSTKRLRVSRSQHIVEFSSQSALARFGGGGGQHRFFYDARAKREVRFEVQKVYNTPEVFVGTVIQVREGEDISALLDEEDVVAVSPVRFYPVPKLVVRTFADSSNPTTSGNDTSTTHIMTGIDKVHARGITGKGMKIGVIDSGIDYRHPFLGGGFGKGHKVVGGYDFVGDNYNGSNMPVPDDDPLDKCNGHGTHVGGIIGMNSGNIYGVSGVAPDAELYVYRTFGCDGDAANSLLIDALLRAYDDGVDVINLSFGDVTGFSQDPVSLVANRIALKGTVVVAAAGNDGESGAWLPKSPASGAAVIAVGSVDNTEILVQNATVFINGQEDVPFPYYGLTPLVNVSTPFEIYPTSTNTSVVGDACDPLPETTPDLSNRVMVIRRGSCPFVQKFQNAAKFGAQLFLIYNVDEQFDALDLGGYTGVLIQASAGEYLVNNFARRNNVTISFKNRVAEIQNTGNGGLMSYFSTLGPSYETGLKPEVSGVGGHVVSTWLNSSFAMEEGTSMAAPLVAGSAALILQARGKMNRTAFAVKDLLESTASPIPSNLTDTRSPQTLAWAGAGLIQIDKAIDTKTIVSPGHLTLNDTAHFQSTQTFTVTNHGTKRMTYRLSNAPAGTLYTFDKSQPALPPYTLTTEYATVKFSKTEFAVDSGQSKTITAKFTAPTTKEKGYPVYSGRIVITSCSGTLAVSYLGVVGSIRDIPSLARSDPSVNFTLPALQLPDGTGQNSTRTYTFVGDDFPTLVVSLLFGSPSVSVDIVEADPRDGSDPKVVGPVRNVTDFDRSPTGVPYTFPIKAGLADGTTLADGAYRVLLKVSRVFGNTRNPRNMETYMSPIIIKDSSKRFVAQPLDTQEVLN